MAGLDRAVQKVVSSMLMFESAERAAPPKGLPQKWIMSGTVLGLIAGFIVMAFLNPQFTGKVVEEQQPIKVTLAFTTPKDAYRIGERIDFQISPPDAIASIAYIREDGGIAMLDEPWFIPQHAGIHTFNALVEFRGIRHRFTRTVEVE